MRPRAAGDTFDVDHIEFSDLPGNRAVMVLLQDLLPARFSAIHPADKASDNPRPVRFDNLVLQPGATETTSADGRRLLTRPVGQGRVVLLDGAVLEPAQAGMSNQRQMAYAFLCGLVGANYAGSGGLQHPKAPGFGSLALAALSGKTTVLPAFDRWTEAWSMFLSRGGFTALDEARPNLPTPLGSTVNGAVATSVTVPAGGTVEVPFLLGWHFPEQIQRLRRLDGMPLRHPMGQCPGRSCGGRARFRPMRGALKPNDSAAPSTTARSLLAAGLYHRQCRHCAAHRE